MKPDMKMVLEEAFAVPKPEHKKEFLRKIEQPKISTFSFMLSQISYIRKRVWVVSVVLLILAVISTEFAGEDSIFVISAMMPFIALCAVTESTRSSAYGMAELEMASRFSLKSIMLARLGVIGLLHFGVLCVLIPLAGDKATVTLGQDGIYLQAGIYLRTSFYLSVPYLLTSVLGLSAVRRIHGKEAVYICMGISVMVSFLNVILKGMIPGLYKERYFIWWVIIIVYLFMKVWNEYQKAVCCTEEMAWN